jgi:hypothetical protein
VPPFGLRIGRVLDAIGDLGEPPTDARHRSGYCGKCAGKPQRVRGIISRCAVRPGRQSAFSRQGRQTPCKLTTSPSRRLCSLAIVRVSAYRSPCPSPYSAAASVPTGRCRSKEPLAVAQHTMSTLTVSPHRQRLFDHA